MAVFAFIFVSMTDVFGFLNLPHPDELWLMVGIVGALITCLARSNPQEHFVKFITPIILLIAGAYAVVLKAPKLLSELVNYRLATLLCLTFYVSFCWIIMQKGRELKKT